MPLPTDPESIINSHIIAGLLGSLVGLKWAPGKTWGERATSVAVGFGCAVYITPGAAEWAQIDSPRALAALSFGAGMFGLSVTGAVSEGIKATKFGEVFTSLLTGLLNMLNRRP